MHISFILYIGICILILQHELWADTVSLINGTEQKGIVVENYHDRIIFSTVNGEKELKKKQIKEIMYDRTEQNLVKLGDFYEQRQNPVQAYSYYAKAVRLNPEYKEAQYRAMHLRAVLLRSPEKQIQEAMARRQALFKESGGIYTPEPAERISNSTEEQLREMTGMVIVSAREMPMVDSIVPGSPADRAGINKGDLIYTLWGRLTGYMELKTIASMIIDSPSPEVILTIARDIRVDTDNPKSLRYGGVGGTGLSLSMREDGLTVAGIAEGSVAAGAGLIKDDLITTIDGRKTRYLPMKDALRYLNNACAKGGFNLSVLRTATIWRKEISR